MQKITSHDGSDTLLSDKYGVTYHSQFGALDESITVFLSAGYEALRIKTSDPIHILEIGFGTGLNALLSVISADRYQRQTQYTGVEAFPLDGATLSSLNYTELFPDYQNTFNNMHSSNNLESIQCTDHFQFTKIIDTIQDCELTERYNLVYFDAFAPTAQPEMWKPDILTKIYQQLDTGGILVTYCAQGQFKRDLKSVGFEVEALPGPGKKREMTRAIKR